MRMLRRILPYILLCILLAVAIFGWLNRDYIRDWLTLRAYSAPQPIAQLAEDTAMSDYGKRLFYVNKPQLDDKIAFNEHCKNLSKEAAVLGCYRGDRQGIYIFDVTDPRLHGVEEVTAAHEMLHQAYSRLSGKERDRVNDLLETYRREVLADQSVKDKLAIYEKTEPDHLVNEMHSIFGSEIKELPAELETYYSQYFSDRQKVVAFRDASQAEFDKYLKQIDSYDQQLAILKPQIESMEAALTQTVAELKQDRQELNADLAAGRIQEYNAGVAPYNAKVSEYNQQLASLNKRIEEYNKLVNERNTASVQISELNKALDSSLAPQ